VIPRVKVKSAIVVPVAAVKVVVDAAPSAIGLVAVAIEFPIVTLPVVQLPSAPMPPPAVAVHEWFPHA
jgi:hypothetical protein